MYYGYVLKIASLDGAYEFEVSFFLDEIQARRWQASGTGPSIEACFDEAQAYKETVLQDHAQHSVHPTKATPRWLEVLANKISGLFARLRN